MATIFKSGFKMSGTFTGFSEDDIKKMQNGVPIQKQTHTGKQVKLVLKNKKSTKPIVRFDESHNKININDVNDIPEEAKLCKSKTDEDTTSNAEHIEVKEQKEINVNEHNVSHIKTDDPIKIEKVQINLDEFEARQKIIEEQNRKRKELLAKVLADKKKQTQDETRKLNEIQNELKKLDADLSNDVKLLRKNIESASIDYMEAQKRYIKIEKEFLDAKFALQQKLEKKELLTGHLCTIIERNEERKAEKLTELLNKLELKDVNESETYNVEVTG